MSTENTRPPELEEGNPVPIFHPALLALYPVLGLYAHNADKISMGAIIRPALLLMIGAGLLALGLRPVYKDRYKAGIAASILVVAALSGWNVLVSLMNLTLPLLSGYSNWLYYIAYAALAAGLLYVVVKRKRKGFGFWWRALALAAGCVLLVLFVDIVLVRVFLRGPAWYMTSYGVLVAAALVFVAQTRIDCRNFTRTLNGFGLILLVLSVANVLYHLPTEEAFTPLPPLEGGEDATQATVSEPMPDIYFIVMGGHGRADVHTHMYGYNETPFIHDMESMGFDYADGSIANYPNALFSLAACLNMEYLHDLHPDTPYDQRQLLQDIHNNRVYGFLKSKGYRLVVFSQGMELLEQSDIIDETLMTQRTVSEFEIVLLQNSALSNLGQMYHFLRYDSRADMRHIIERGRVFQSLDQLDRLPTDPDEAPHFVMAYFTVPEPPFFFRQNGSWPKSAGLFTYAGRSVFTGSERDYRESYNDQLAFTNDLLERTIRALLDQSSRPAIVIVASAHGPSSALALGAYPGMNVQERFANLLMVRFPPELDAQPNGGVYNSISLVNLFRVVLNRVFQTKFDLLADEAYMVKPGEPFTFEPVRVAVTGD